MRYFNRNNFETRIDYHLLTAYLVVNNYKKSEAGYSFTNVIIVNNSCYCYKYRNFTVESITISKTYFITAKRDFSHY